MTLISRWTAGPLRSAALSLGFAILAGCSGGDAGTGPNPPSPPTPPAVDRTPATLVAVAGQNQTAPALVPVRDSLVVRVLDGGGQPVSDVTVTWRLASGSGEMLEPNSRSNASGEARLLVIPAEGPLVVQATVGSLPPVSFSITGSTPAVSAGHMGRRGYTEYRPGTLPIILSAPHGGGVEPAEIPVRAGGTQTRDLNTADLAERMADALEARFGARPHLILFHLHRRMVDANREIREAAEGHPLGEHAWREFQGMVDHARARVEREHGRGLYLDIHGHGHTIQRLELGYLLTATELRLTGGELDALVSKSSVRAAVGRSDASLGALLRGPSAMGTRLAEAGYASVPSAADPAPNPGEPYFSGGYNTQQWGSRTTGNVDGIQIEANFTGVRDTAANREAFAQAAASVIAAFMADWYGWDP